MPEQVINSGRTYRSTLNPVISSSSPQRASLLSPDSQRKRSRKKSNRRAFLILVGSTVATLAGLGTWTVYEHSSSSSQTQPTTGFSYTSQGTETGTAKPKFVETTDFPEAGTIWESEIFLDNSDNRMKVIRFQARPTEVPIIAVKPNTHTTQLGFFGETEDVVNSIISTYGDEINNSEGWPKPVKDEKTGAINYPAQIIDVSNQLGRTVFARYIVKGTPTEDPQFEAAIATNLDQVESDITEIQEKPGLNIIPSPFALTLSTPGVNEIPVYTQVMNPLG